MAGAAPLEAVRAGGRGDLRVLAVGNVERPELASSLAACAAPCGLETIATPAEAALRLARAETLPDVIVLVQARPGEISDREVDALRRAAPLVRLVGLLGSWCEGEVRTGSPWPGVPRIYWHAWPLRWEAELARASLGWLPSWAQPETATEEDRAPDWASVPALPPGRVAICALDRDLADWLHDACLALGQQPIRAQADCSERISADALIWDCPGAPSEHEQELRAWADRVRPAGVLVLASFPRWQDAVALTAAGAACMVSKPLRLDELAAGLRLARAAPARDR